jgi:hypothetical protein
VVKVEKRLDFDYAMSGKALAERQGGRADFSPPASTEGCIALEHSK